MISLHLQYSCQLFDCGRSLSPNLFLTSDMSFWGPWELFSSSSPLPGFLCLRGSPSALWPWPQPSGNPAVTALSKPLGYFRGISIRSLSLYSIFGGPLSRCQPSGGAGLCSARCEGFVWLKEIYLCFPVLPLCGREITKLARVATDVMDFCRHWHLSPDARLYPSPYPNLTI